MAPADPCGCIPTKALLHTASLLDEIRDAEQFGVEVAAPRLDLSKAQAYKRKVVDGNAKGIEFLFKKNGVQGIQGTGRWCCCIRSRSKRDGAKTVYQAKNIIVATGSVRRSSCLLRRPMVAMF